MSPGKLAAQAGHAFVDTLHDAETNWDTDSAEYRDYLRYKNERPGTKVVLVAPDEQTLRRIYEHAIKWVPSSIIFDSGHVMPPHFDGSSILTAVGLGPCTRDKAAFLLPKLALAP